MNKDAYQLSYAHNVLFWSKLIQVLLSSFIMGLSFASDNYGVLYLSYHKNRLKYIISKLIILICVCVFFGFFLLVLYIICGYVFTPWYIIRMEDIVSFIYLISISLIYGLLAALLVHNLKSLLTSIIPFVLFLCSEFSQSIAPAKISAGINFFFPSLIEEGRNLALLFGIYHLMILAFFYALLLIISYHLLDLA